MTWMWLALLDPAAAGTFDLLTKEKQGVATEDEAVDVQAAEPPLDVEVAEGWPPLTRRPPPEAERTESGVSWIVVEPGDGPTPAGADSRVTVHYTGWMAKDGTKFDSSVDRGEPLSFRLDQVIPGWTEGVQQLHIGDRARLWIPGSLAYGDVQAAEGRPYGTLIFDIELLAVEDVERRPVPEDVAGPPDDAEVTDSGLAYKVLERGEGDGPRPAATSYVTVHYTGWHTDGTEFDSSHARGTPATFRLNGVIRGWTEGVQHMQPGDVYRFWIPERLAYQGAPGKPEGMLVFDIELIDIEE